MIKALALSASLVLSATVATAQANPIELSDAIGTPEVIEIMREEGIAYAEDLRRDMLNGQGGDGFTARIDAIYDVDQMLAVFEDSFTEQLGDADLAPLLEFFQSERGRRIIALELSGRRALMDETIEELSREALAEAEANNDARLAMIQRFSDVNALVDTNVEGALNSNYAFMTALQDGGAFEQSMTQQQIVIDVWAQEPEIRAETRTWVLSYLLMAYGPLSDDDLEIYIALSETDEGQALNRALFVAFDVMFTEISAGLGHAVAYYIGSQDI